MATTTDLHALLANRSLGKARAFLSNARPSNASASSGGAGSSLLSRSPGSSHAQSSAQLNAGAQAVAQEVNRRDHLGRTVLHLVVGEVEEWALDLLASLLRVGGLQINAVDVESGWTALHRALYYGNISAARLLLAHPQIDASIKDHEGLSAFDLYNSTVDGTNPTLTATALPTSTGTLSSSTASPSTPTPANPGRLELFTWGANRNFVLGFAGDSDRTYPERVQLNRHEGGTGLAAWDPLRVKDVSMARLHTGIVTDEKRNNVRLCGYGTGGRLGPTTQTQFTFQPLQGFPHQVKQAVLSPDHTVVVTAQGDVYTFGLNRFSQLGYALDSPAPGAEKNPATASGKQDEPIQATPRRVVGALKKETVLGAACSRTHTAVFTADSVFTWGTSRGQLGYATSEPQILPRKVTILPAPCIQLAATETATACLLETNEVVVLYRDAYHKLVFPLTPFPSRMQAYRPPNVGNKPNIKKITACGTTFAALSSLGDVFTFAIEANAAQQQQQQETGGRTVIKPQRIWDLRRKFTAVTDVGVGLDGSIILCTVSGHVYVRTKKFEVSNSASGSKSGALSSSIGAGSAGGGGGWKFARVPFLQRCIRVAANSTGAFAALRADVPLRFIEIEGPSLAENLLGVLPHWRRVGPLGAKLGSQRRQPATEDEDDDVDASIERDVEVALRLMQVLDDWNATWEVPLKGSDALLVVEGKRIPVHSLVLAARSPILAQKVQASDGGVVELDCAALPALLLLHYLYSDDLPALWDGRVFARLRELRPELNLDVQALKGELLELALELHLPHLAQSLSLHVKNAPSSSLALDLGELLHPTNSAQPIVKPDIVLVLADREVLCHSIVLRARCSFFETFYDDDEWTKRRLEAQGGVLRFDLSHFDWSVVRLVLEHIYLDKGMSLFQSVDWPTADEYIDFVTLVLSAANELLLDKLKLVCSAVLRSFVTLHNVGAILVDAAFYEANELQRACMYFIASSIETVLENRLLDDLPEELVDALGEFVRERQGAKSPLARSGLLWTEMMVKHRDWMNDLDLGRPTGGAKKFVRTAVVSKSPRFSAQNTPQLLSPNSSPMLTPSKLHTPGGSPRFAGREDDVPFAMDEDDFQLDAPARTPQNATPSASAVSLGAGGRRKSTPGGGATPVVAGSPGSRSFLPLGSPPPPRLQPWGAQAAPGASTDNSLVAIMARESAANSSSKTRPSLVAPLGGGSSLMGGGASSSGGSWRATPPVAASATAKGRPSLLDIQSEQSASRPRPEQVRTITRHPTAPAPTPAQTSSSPPVARSAAPGPIFTPSRMTDRSALSSSSSRMQWTNYGPSAAVPSPPMVSFSPPAPAPTFTPPALRPSASSFSPGIPFTPAPAPNPPSPVPSSPAAAQSFAQIQAAQRAELDLVREQKAVRSFADVMAAEQAQALQRREEELVKAREAKEAREFEKWFEEESRRVRQEELKVRAMIAGEGGAGAGQGGGGRRKSGGGKGKRGAKENGATTQLNGGGGPSGAGSPNPRKEGARAPRKGKARASESGPSSGAGQGTPSKSSA